MHKILILGAGKIGTALGELLGRQQDYQICLADMRSDRPATLPDHITYHQLDVTDQDGLIGFMSPFWAVLSACPYYLNEGIAAAARATGTHYFDLTEDVATTKAIREMAQGADTVFMPQCGLAPGFIGIAGHALAQKFDKLDSLHMRVGALPQYPTNSLKYNLTWSTDGLINEYCNPCEAIHDGQMRDVLPLEGREEFSLDGVRYEAFNTSGGLGTLCESWADQVQSLNYKTVRYPGHCHLMRVMVNEFGLANRRDVLKDVLETSVPMTFQDVVLIFISASGWRQGQFVQESFLRKIYHQEIDGRCWSAIQVTTAAGIATVVDLLRQGILKGADGKAQGFIRQEDVVLSEFLDNEFGKYYR